MMIMMMMMMMTHTYRARPVLPGCCVLREFCTLALSIRLRGWDLIAPWLLGQVVEMVWSCQVHLSFSWWLECVRVLKRTPAGLNLLEKLCCPRLCDDLVKVLANKYSDNLH